MQEMGGFSFGSSMFFWINSLGSSLFVMWEVVICLLTTRNLIIIIREILGVFMVFFSSNYNVTFKIINRLKVNNNNFKFNDNFRSHIIIGKKSGKH